MGVSEFGLQIGELRVVSLARIFDLRLVFSLHLRLLQKHALPQLVQTLLGVNLHSVLDATYLLFALLKISLQLAPFLTQLLISLLKCLNLAVHFKHITSKKCQSLRQVPLKQLIIRLLKLQLKVCQSTELVRFDNLKSAFLLVEDSGVSI